MFHYSTFSEVYLLKTWLESITQKGVKCLKALSYWCPEIKPLHQYITALSLNKALLRKACFNTCICHLLPCLRLSTCLSFDVCRSQSNFSLANYAASWMWANDVCCNGPTVIPCICNTLKQVLLKTDLWKTQTYTTRLLSRRELTVRRYKGNLFELHLLRKLDSINMKGSMIDVLSVQMSYK